MAPVPSSHQLYPRDEASGTPMSVAFAVIAFVVIAGCILWGYCLPKWRKKHPPSPSATRFNGLGYAGNTSTASPYVTTFPSHPAILRGFHRQPPRHIRCYDPRTETPFPSSPPTGETISLQSIKVSRTSSSDPRDLNDSDGLFSPVKSSMSGPRGRSHSMSLSPCTFSDLAGNGTSGERYGDAEEYILALPEPLLLKPKSAGRAPPLAKQLTRFPMPCSSSGITERLEHPKKLFERLEQDGRDTGLSTGRAEQSGSDNGAASDTSPVKSLMLKGKRYGNSRKQTQLILEHSTCSADAVTQSTTTYVKGVSAGKKACWRPFTGWGASEGSGLQKRGTITRPKTPVSEIRHLYDRSTAEVNSTLMGHPSLKKNTTPSTEPLTASESADSHQLTTSTRVTSISRTSDKLDLLPTPLRPRQEGIEGPRATPTPDHRNRCATPSSAAPPESPDRLAPLRKTLKSSHKRGRSIGFYHASHRRKNTRTNTFGIAGSDVSKQAAKTRPANLNLTTSSRMQPELRHHRSQSMSSVGSMLSPLIGPKATRSSLQASSVYSRDTKGLSLNRTPISPTFPTDAIAREESAQGRPRPKRADSLDLVRSKIDGWDLHTADLLLTTSRAAPLKRTLSDLGPRSPGLPFEPCNHLSPPLTDEKPSSFGLGISVPTICVARSSDDIFCGNSSIIRDTGPLQMRTVDMEASTTESKVSARTGRTAPGGAEWI